MLDGGTMWKTAVVLIAVMTLACTSGEAKASKAVCKDYFTFLGKFVSVGQSSVNLYIEMEGREELEKINALAENAKPEIRELMLEISSAPTPSNPLGLSDSMVLLIAESSPARPTSWVQKTKTACS